MKSLKSLGVVQRKVLKALREREVGWYPGCPGWRLTGNRAQQVLDSLVKRGLAQMAMRWFPDIGTVPNYTITAAGANLVDAEKRGAQSNQASDSWGGTSPELIGLAGIRVASFCWFDKAALSMKGVFPDLSN